MPSDDILFTEPMKRSGWIAKPSGDGIRVHLRKGWEPQVGVGQEESGRPPAVLEPENPFNPFHAATGPDIVRENWWEDIPSIPPDWVGREQYARTWWNQPVSAGWTPPEADRPGHSGHDDSVPPSWPARFVERTRPFLASVLGPGLPESPQQLDAHPELIAGVATPGSGWRLRKPRPPLTAAEKTAWQAAGFSGPSAPSPTAMSRALAKDVYDVPVSEIGVDPSRFQFKMDTDPKTGAGKALKGVDVWDPKAAGTITLWEDNSGKLWVVNGHHRLALARRTGQPSLKSYIMREAEGVTEQDAKREGALLNMREGGGTALDAAKFLRNSEIPTESLEADLRARGIPLHTAMMDSAVGLYHLDDGLFRRVITGQMDEGLGVALGKGLPGDAANQRAIADMAENAKKRLRPDEIESLIAEARNEIASIEQADLFGMSKAEKSTLVERARLRSAVRRELIEPSRVLGFVAKEERQRQLARGKNIINQEESDRLARLSGQQTELFDVLVDRVGPVSEAIKEGGQRVARGEAFDQVSQAVTARIRRALEESGSASRPGYAGVGAENIGPPVAGEAAQGWEAPGVGQDEPSGSEQPPDFGQDPLSYFRRQTERIGEQFGKAGRYWQKGDILGAAREGLMGGAEAVGLPIDVAYRTAVGYPVGAGLAALQGTPNPMGWQQAQQSYEGLPLGIRLPAELLVPNIPIAKLQKGLTVANRLERLRRAPEAERLAARAEGVARWGPIVPTGEPAAAPIAARTPSAAMATAGQAASLGLQYGPAAAMVWTGATRETDEEGRPRELGERVRDVIAGGAAGALVGMGILHPAASKFYDVLSARVGAKTVHPYPPIGENMTVEAQAERKSIYAAQEAKRLGAGGEVEPGKPEDLPLYPGKQSAYQHDFRVRAFGDLFAGTWRIEDWLQWDAATRGEKLSAADRPYMMVRNLTGTGPAFNAYFTKDVEPALKEAIHASGPDFLPKLTRYWTYVSKQEHAIAGKKSGPHGTADPAEAAIRLAESVKDDRLTPREVKAFDRLIRANTEVRNRFITQDMVDTELIMPENAAKVVASHETWGWLYEEADMLERAERKVGMAGKRDPLVAVFKSPIGQFKSAEREAIVDPVRSMASIAYLISVTQRQRAMLALIKNAERHPDTVGTLVKQVRVIPKGEREAMADFVKAAKETGAELSPEQMVGLPKDEMIPEGWLPFRIMRRGIETDKDGKQTEAIVHEVWRAEKSLIEPYLGLSAEATDLISGVMSKFTHFFRLGVTSASIPFLFRNPQRDLLTAMQNTGMTTQLVEQMLGSVLDLTTQGKLGELLDWARRKPGMMEHLAGWVDRRITDPWTGERYSETFYKAGAGHGTMAESVKMPKSIRQSIEQEIGREGKGLMPGLVLLPLNPLDWIRNFSELTEMFTRLSVFRAERKEQIAEFAKTGVRDPLFAQAAGFVGKTATVDFSKFGTAMRVANSWMPLLNARVQGQMRTLDAFKENPQAYTARIMMTTIWPFLVTYHHNREMFGDLYDKIPMFIRDNNFPIVIGSYQDQFGDERPMYIPVPKDEWQKILTIPLEHTLDTMFHQHSQGQYLKPEQRTEREWWMTVSETIANASPINVNPSAIYDGNWVGLLASIPAAHPGIGTAVQLWANKDYQNDQPILPWYAQYVEQEHQIDRSTGPMAQAISHAIGIPTGGTLTPAPAYIAYAVRHLGGGLGNMFLGAGDVLVDALGIVPQKPVNMSQLLQVDPTDKDKFASYVTRLNGADMRPWYVKILPALLGGAGGAQSQVAKVQNLHQKDQNIWQDTRELWQAYQLWVQQDYTPKLRQATDDLASGKITHGQFISQYFNLSRSRGDAIAGLKARYRDAITDPKERREFLARMPGVPVKGLLPKTLQEAPADRIDEAVQRYTTPPDLPPNAPPQAQGAARGRELSKLSHELGMDQKDLLDQIRARIGGKQVPVITIPAVWLDDYTNRYLHPTSLDTSNLNGKEILDAREAELHAMLGELRAAGHPDVTLDNLRARIQLHLSRGDGFGPATAMLEAALRVSENVRNEMLHPRYMTAEGKPVGEPSIWSAWDAQIEHYKGQKLVPQEIKALKEQKQWGEVYRLNALFSNPDYAYYQRFFGMGRQLTGTQWEAFQRGEAPKYVDPQTKQAVGTPEDWRAWDATLSIYRALPKTSQLARQLVPQVKRYRLLLNKGWREALMWDEVNQRKDSETWAAIDRAFEEADRAEEGPLLSRAMERASRSRVRAGALAEVD